jgi:hypothetical protein
MQRTDGGNEAMFEVVVTYRPDFDEKVVERHPTRELAQAAADQLLAQKNERIIRVWVRQACQTKSKS